MNLSDGPFVTARDACAYLNISPQTLYAYVSRGFIRVAQDPDDARKSLYLMEDLKSRAALKRRGRSRRAVATSVLDWGEPALVSTITQIRAGRFYYREQDAVDLAEHATLEDIAALLLESPLEPAQASIRMGTDTSPFGRMLMYSAQMAAVGGPNSALDLVQALVAAAMGQEASPQPFHCQVGQAWGLGAPETDVIRRVLVLCADHELNASAFATRVTASTGAAPAACLMTGLATLSGPQHGGMVDRALTWMDGAITSGVVSVTDGPPPGFGHPLYPRGDPRAAALFAALPVPSDWQRVIDHLRDNHDVHPSLDIALAHVTRHLRLPHGSGLVLFAIGRSAGWLAHAREQQASGQLIRPRARPSPQVSASK